MDTNSNTTVVDRHIVFLKDADGWYADMEGTRAQNAMVSGADVLCETLAGGKDRVELVFSSDVAEPGEHLFRLHRILHDPWGATYRVGKGTRGEAPRFGGIMGLPLVWLCCQVHRFIGGEHPQDIYVHAVIA